MPNNVKATDVVKSIADELGDCLAITRTKAQYAEGQTRDDLLAAYKVLARKLQKLVLENVRAIDGDIRITASVEELSMYTQQLAKARREMQAAKAIIDRVTQVAGWVDQLLKFFK